MSNYKTEQESFWAGDFGDEYADRNAGIDWVASNTAFFSEILNNTRNIQSVIEFGSSIGLNLQAINRLIPNASLSAIEINEKAVSLLKDLDIIRTIHHQSILDFMPQEEKHDLVLIKGVLIHINPEKLTNVYEKLYQSCNRYVLIAEYYNPTPVEINYRGHDGRLFKRDFAGEFLRKYNDMKLVNYGFVWKNDPNFPQDDISWFLMEKE